MSEPRVIKKYSNRRLYDSRQSCYITLENLKEMIMAGETFRVENAKDGADITRQVLSQIVLDEEVFGVPLFSEQTLRNLIMFCGNPMHGALSGFLDKCVPMFADMQNRYTREFGKAGAAGREWEQFATMQGQMLSRLAEDYFRQNMNAYARAQKQFRASAEKMFQFPDIGGVFTPPAAPGDKKTEGDKKTPKR
jgi:polyhydroxyalkanoate synthesis repressor PhaR